MATKTISVDIEAYERLRQARRSPDESFSRVIKRAHWAEGARTAGEFLKALEALPPPSPESIDLLDRAQREDRIPESPWPND